MELFHEYPVFLLESIDLLYEGNLRFLSQEMYCLY